MLFNFTLKVFYSLKIEIKEKCSMYLILNDKEFLLTFVLQKITQIRFT